MEGISMKRLAIAGQKGGIGKSSITRAVAVGLAEKGKSVMVADLDIRQQTATDWSKAREYNSISPRIRVVPLNVSREGWEIESDEKIDFLIYDCPGFSDEHTVEIARLADLTVLPTSSSQDDLRPIVRLCHEMNSLDVVMDGVVIALFRVATNAEDQAARSYLKKAKIGVDVLDGSIRESQEIKREQGHGLTAIETGTPTHKASAQKLVNAIVAKLEEAGTQAIGEADWSKLDWSVV